MFTPPRVPLEDTGHAAIRVPVLLLFGPHDSSRTYQRGATEQNLVYLQGTIMTSQGLTHIEPGHFKEGDLPWLKMEEAKGSVGAFLAVFKDEQTGEFTLVNDFHGFQQVFYSDLGQGNVAISDSLLALSQHLRQHGRSIEINEPTLIGQYGAFNALLNHHAFSTQTIVDNISQVRSDQTLRLSRSGVVTENRPRFFDPKERDYSELISDAVTRGSEFISAALEWDVQDKVLFLSGGRDSRSILAMALAGGTEKEFPVFAKAPPVGTSTFSQKLSIDRQLSGQLVDEYDLNIWADSFTTRLPNSTVEREWWLSHWGGIMHDYGSPKTGTLTPSIRLIGAMGANFRTKVPDYIGHMRDVDFRMTEASFDDDFENFFTRISPIHPSSNKAAWDTTRDMFRDSLTFDDLGSAFWERLDAYSEVFRMPAHFGGTIVEQSMNVWNLNILALPELTYAASLLSRDQRSSGKVWKDLHEVVDHHLNEIPYEFEAMNTKGGYHSIALNDSSVNWDTWDVRHSSNMGHNTKAIAHLTAQGEPRKDHKASDRLLNKLRGVIAPAVGQPRVNHLISRAKDRSLLLKRLRGKLELLDELVDPQVTWNPIRVHLFYGNR